MTESRLTYDQFKADILRWKNSHREEYNRFARLMTNGDERQYLAICRAIFKQLPKVKIEWELCWGDDSVEDFDNINLLFSEESVPEQIVEAFQKQREENNASDGASSSFWNKVKSFFRSKSKRHGIILSAPLVLSWLYYGKSFEAMVSMVNKQSANPKADRMDRQSCSWVAERIIQVSIKNGFRTQSDWDRYFSMNDAIEKGNIGEWALQSVINENGANGDMVNDKTNTPIDTDCDATSKIHRTAGKKKIQERPLIDYLDCNNKEEVLEHIRNFISINTHHVNSQVQILPSQINIKTVSKIRSWITYHCTVIISNFAITVNISKFQVTRCYRANRVNRRETDVVFVLIYTLNLVTIEIANRITFGNT